MRLLVAVTATLWLAGCSLFELDPTAYPNAITVLEGDYAFAEDGQLSVTGVMTNVTRSTLNSRGCPGRFSPRLQKLELDRWIGVAEDYPCLGPLIPPLLLKAGERVNVTAFITDAPNHSPKFEPRMREGLYRIVVLLAEADGELVEFQSNPFYVNG
ncbi:MAG: hypothetical protein AAGI08_18395 [Bacteroidota bacterium]